MTPFTIPTLSQRYSDMRSNFLYEYLAGQGLIQEDHIQQSHMLSDCRAKMLDKMAVTYDVDERAHLLNKIEFVERDIDRLNENYSIKTGLQPRLYGMNGFALECAAKKLM